MTIRQLIANPFRHYGDFSGRSGRAEYWLLILMFVLLTEFAWFIGFGGMRLAGYQADDHRAHFQKTYEKRFGETAQPPDPDGTQEDDESHVVFTLHRHDEGGFHLHGSWRQWRKHLDRDPASDEEHTGLDPAHSNHADYRDDDILYAEDGAEILELIVALTMLVPILGTGARRLHDTGKSGWWQLFVLIPVAGWLVLAIFLLVRGEPNKNRFGPPVSG